MIDNLVGIAIGAEIDREDGGFGTGDAVELPLQIGWTVRYLARHAWESTTAG